MQRYQHPGGPRRWFALLAVFLAIVATRCGGRTANETTLRLAVLPILDVLPLYVAEAEGFFGEEGVVVQLVPAGSAAERDQMLQAGQVDGIVTDLVALALYNRPDTAAEPGVIAVRYAMVPTERHAQFRILASGTSRLTAPSDLAGVAVGVSEGTVIEYVTDRILTAEGLAPEEIATLSVPQIPERMALLDAGELQAATLPEPLASLAIQQGARVIVDDRQYRTLGCSVFAFRRETLARAPDAVRAILRAIDRASAAINADKSRWQGMMTTRQLVPAPLIGAYDLPDYPSAAVPTEDQFADVLAWLQETGRLATGPSYDDVVDATFLQ